MSKDLKESAVLQAEAWVKAGWTPKQMIEKWLADGDAVIVDDARFPAKTCTVYHNCLTDRPYPEWPRYNCRTIAFSTNCKDFGSPKTCTCILAEDWKNDHNETGHWYLPDRVEVKIVLEQYHHTVKKMSAATPSPEDLQHIRIQLLNKYVEDITFRLKEAAKDTWYLKWEIPLDADHEEDIAYIKSRFPRFKITHTPSAPHLYQSSTNRTPGKLHFYWGITALKAMNDQKKAEGQPVNK